ncbi:MAG: hypothetical protein E7646_09055 [Ruminococcaceae bacterium]|nr:hypothetical protein [Oscillospiraceae bacterium]
MLSVYDLYDLHAILVRIRFSPDDTVNCDIILRVIDVLTDSRNNFDNSDSNLFRTALQLVNGLENNDLYDFAFVENKYSYFPLPPLKDERIYTVLIRSFEELLCVIENNNKEQILELSDCVHNLPIFIVENKLTIPKSFWKNEIKYYRKKWNNRFLVPEQQLFKS